MNLLFHLIHRGGFSSRLTKAATEVEMEQDENRFAFIQKRLKTFLYLALGDKKLYKSWNDATNDIVVILLKRLLIVVMS